MSINVTVTGNPISVKQGRMVTASPNHSKKEFERRRLIRLSQVRQQSKNIAEDVRNRVRQQKLKQVEEIQKEGQRKLKQWQARKLLELQNQYHEALKDIGAGHKEAGLLEGEIDTKSEKKENDDKIAMQRASVANKKLQEEKEKLKQRLSVPIQKKKLVRKIEDKRAHIVTELRRSTESFKKKNNEKLSVQTEVSGIVTESDSDYEDIEEGSIPIDTNIRTEVEPSDSSQKNSKKTVPLKVIEEFSEKNAACESEGHSAEKVPFSDYDEQLLQDLRREKDTRISDRIRKRSSHQLDQPDVCDSLSQPCPIHQKNSSQNVYAAPSKKSVTVSEGSQTMFSNIQQNIYTCSCKRNFPSVPNTPCDCTHPTPRIQKPGLSDINRFKCVDFTDDEDNSRSCKFQKNHMQKAEVKQSAFAPPSSSKRIATQETRSQRISKEIPTKPKVTLKSVKSPLKNSGILSDKTIQQLQSKTRQSRFLATHVEKIVEENLVTSPEPETEFDFYEKIRQRDKEALLRGQKALEREKLQREYNELMRKLPALQKLERLYGMNQDKPEYHMTEERLREQERKKQNILDNTYEKLFPDRRPPTVTIPIKNIPLDNIKDKVKVPRSDDSVSLNLGVWEADRKSKKLYTEDEVEAMLCEGKIPSESKFRTDQLKSVLEKLRKQKEELLKEIQNLPNGAEKLSSVKHSKKVKDPISTDSCAEIENPERTDTTENSKYILKNSKKYVSVKVGTNSTLQSSSSYETIEEPVEKQSKTAKQVKPTSRAVQVTSQKSKASVKTKKIIKPTSPQKISKKRRSEKEIISSSDQSLSDEKVTKNKLSSKENLKSSVNPPHKKKKPAEVNIAEHSVTPLVPTNTLTSLDVQSKTSKDETPQNIRQIISCDCNKDSALKKKSELCEIVIKIKDGKSSEVLIKDKKENVNSELKSANVEKFRSNKKVEENELLQKQNELRKALKDDCCQSKNDSKASSWHEKFSRNNSQVSNSSTSYMSPPQLPNKSEPESRPPSYFCQLLGKKPQQHNLDHFSRIPPQNQNVYDEVKKLLTMSRVSIDELGVSSVSTVTTPSQSIIDLESNKANMSTTHNTSTTHLSINTRTNQKIDVSSNAQNGLPNFSFLTVSSDNRTIVASEIDSNSEQYPDILAKYAKIADQCSQRISNLSAMIEKVREEKNKMLQTPSLLVTNDSSTRYMDLPSPKKYFDEKDSAQYKSASSSSSEEGRNLLEIDLSLAEKLKGLTPEEIRRYENTGFLESSLTDCKAEEDLAKRLRALKEPVLKDQISSKDQHVSQEQLLKYSGNGDSVDFIPFLLNIPKMPPLTVEPTSGKHKKPPPSKGLLVTRKITEDFATVPHELSTIPEQDSQTRFENTLKEKSPITPKDRRNSSVKESIPEPKKALVLETKKIPTLSEKLREETLENVITQVNDKLRSCESHSEQESSSLQTETKRLTSNQNRTSVKVRELLNHSDNSLGSSNTSGDEKIEMFRIEAMLRSIGMDWAISTLRKTQEALALTSSSSSLDIKSSAAIKELSESDIKEYLTKQIFQKISSSTLRSDASPGSLNESHELSGIQNADFANKQTSTPVNRSRELLKSDEKSSDSPSAIALEKESKDFFSLPEHSP